MVVVVVVVVVVRHHAATTIAKTFRGHRVYHNVKGARDHRHNCLARQAAVGSRW